VKSDIGASPTWKRAGTTTKHVHLDHLGTIRLITSSSGTTLATHYYYPFGQEASNGYQDTERMKFTGHERDLRDGSNTTDDLDYMHARYYNPNLGRFLSVDPGRDSEPRMPQSWNCFAYVRGNPLVGIDSDGRALDVVLDIVSIGYDVFDIGRTLYHGEKVSKTQLLALGGDVAGAVVPFLTGVGAGIRAVRGADLAFNSAPVLHEGSRLRNIVGQLFRGGDKIPGGTAGAIGKQLSTGQLVGGKDHIKKGAERLLELDKMLKSGTLDAKDTAVAQGLKQDLETALKPLLDMVNGDPKALVKVMNDTDLLKATGTK